MGLTISVPDNRLILKGYFAATERWERRNKDKIIFFNRRPSVNRSKEYMTDRVSDLYSRADPFLEPFRKKRNVCSENMEKYPLGIDFSHEKNHRPYYPYYIFLLLIMNQ